MKHLIRNTLAAAVLAASLNVAVGAEKAPAGYVDFGKFSPSSSGGEFVEVHVKNNLISMVARLAEKAEPSIAEMLRGLQVVRVNVIGLKDDNREEVTGKIKNIREELMAKGWERIVTAQETNQDVSVFLKTRGSEAIEGLVVTVVEGNKQAVLVNIVGDIKPDKLATVGERLNIEPLKKLGPVFEKPAAPKKEDSGF